MGAAGGGDVADGDGPVEPEGVADGDGPLPGAEPVGVPQRGHRKRAGGGVDLEHGQIGLGVAPHDRGLELPVVGEVHLHRVGVLHHVVVGQDVALGIHDDAGPGRTDVLARLAPAEEALEELGAEELPEALLPLRRLGFGRDPLGLDAHVDDGGGHAVGHGDEGILERAQNGLRVDGLGVGRSRRRRRERQPERAQHDGEKQERGSPDHHCWTSCRAILTRRPWSR